MDVVVTDTNIFIDLISLDLIDKMFELPFNVHTVDFVLAELWDEQKEVLLHYQQENLLFVHTSSAQEIEEIYELNKVAGGNVSVADCAAWLYAKKNDYRLLTGDRQLRNKAQSSNVQVSGIIYVFDKFVSNGVLGLGKAADKLEELQRRNVRLPKAEIEKRLDTWRSEGR